MVPPEEYRDKTPTHGTPFSSHRLSKNDALSPGHFTMLQAGKIAGSIPDIIVFFN
jgi:hypothetical protein